MVSAETDIITTVFSDPNFWIAFFSPVVLVCAAQYGRFLDLLSGKRRRRNQYKYLKMFSFYASMLVACALSGFLVGLYIMSGVKFTPVLTLNLSLTSNFAFKKFLEVIEKLQSEDKRVDK